MFAVLALEEIIFRYGANSRPGCGGLVWCVRVGARGAAELLWHILLVISATVTFGTLLIVLHAVPHLLDVVSCLSQRTALQYWRQKESGS